MTVLPTKWIKEKYLLEFTLIDFSRRWIERTFQTEVNASFGIKVSLDNEVVDEFARQGANQPWQGSEPNFGISRKQAISARNEWIEKNINTSYVQTERLRKR